MFYSKDKCLALFSIECKAYENNFLFESKAFFNQYLEKQIFEEKTGMDFKLSQAILKVVINNKQRTINLIH